MQYLPTELCVVQCNSLTSNENTFRLLQFPWTLSCQNRMILGLFKGVLQVSQYQQVANLEADNVRSKKNGVGHLSVLHILQHSYAK